MKGPQSPKVTRSAWVTINELSLVAASSGTWQKRVEVERSNERNPSTLLELHDPEQTRFVRVTISPCGYLVVLVPGLGWVKVLLEIERLASLAISFLRAWTLRLS